MKTKFYALALAGVVAVGLAAEAKAEVNFSINLGVPLVVAPSQRVSMHRYRYYPSWEVYFEPEAGMWFWWEGTIWRNSRDRPPRMYYWDRNYVHVEIDDDSPRRHHRDIRTRYPRDYRWNRDHHERWDRDRREWEERSRDRDRDHRDDGDRGRGDKDRGKGDKDRRDKDDRDKQGNGHGRGMGR